MVSSELFKFLLQIALASCSFDEKDYLAANPDVAEAVKKGEMTSGRKHFIGFGYFEGRTGGMPEFDENWYLDTYPDVAAAVESARVASGAEHFQLVGAIEGRSPTAREEASAAEWKRVLGT
jgi:hypothetical protein